MEIFSGIRMGIFLFWNALYFYQLPCIFFAWTTPNHDWTRTMFYCWYDKVFKSTNLDSLDHINIPQYFSQCFIDQLRCFWLILSALLCFDIATKATALLCGQIDLQFSITSWTDTRNWSERVSYSRVLLLLWVFRVLSNVMWPQVLRKILIAFWAPMEVLVFFWLSRMESASLKKRL